MKMTKEMKIFGILALFVMILIFGALVGILISINNSPGLFLDDDMIVLNADDLENIGIESITESEVDFDDIVTFETRSYSLDEFSRFTKYKFSSTEGLIDYLESVDFEYEIEEEESGEEVELFAEKDLGCSLSEIYNTTLCSSVIVFYDGEEDHVSIERIEFLEWYYEEEDDE